MCTCRAHDGDASCFPGTSPVFLFNTGRMPRAHEGGTIVELKGELEALNFEKKKNREATMEETIPKFKQGR